MAAVPGNGATPGPDPGARVRGRDQLLNAAERLLNDARERHGGALTVLGGIGMGKTTLLRAICGYGTGCQLLRTTGVAPESTLPMSGLHRLLQPLSRRAADLSVPQRGGLADPLGQRTPPATADFALCSAVYRVFVELSRVRPVLCCVDDAHWLD